MAEAYRDAFPIGVAMASPLTGGFSEQELALLRRQFHIATPANCLKWKHLQAGLDDWHFEKADAFVQWVTTQKLKALGHCLIWNREKYDLVWLFEGESGPASKELVPGNPIAKDKQLMRQHQHGSTGRNTMVLPPRPSSWTMDVGW